MVCVVRRCTFGDDEWIKVDKHVSGVCVRSTKASHTHIHTQIVRTARMFHISTTHHPSSCFVLVCVCLYLRVSFYVCLNTHALAHKRNTIYLWCISCSPQQPLQSDFVVPSASSTSARVLCPCQTGDKIEIRAATRVIFDPAVQRNPGALGVEAAERNYNTCARALHADPHSFKWMTDWDIGKRPPFSVCIHYLWGRSFAEHIELRATLFFVPLGLPGRFRVMGMCLCVRDGAGGTFRVLTQQFPEDYIMCTANTHRCTLPYRLCAHAYYMERTRGANRLHIKESRAERFRLSNCWGIQFMRPDAVRQSRNDRDLFSATVVGWVNSLAYCTIVMCDCVCLFICCLLCWWHWRFILCSSSAQRKHSRSTCLCTKLIAHLIYIWMTQTTANAAL